MYAVLKIWLILNMKYIFLRSNKDARLWGIRALKSKNNDEIVIDRDRFDVTCRGIRRQLSWKIETQEVCPHHHSPQP